MAAVLTSMELDDEQKLDAPMPIRMPSKPDFPFGLRICLTNCELDKLNLDISEAVVGGIVHGQFIGRITNVSASDGDTGPSSRTEIQIESLCLDCGEG